MAESNLSLESPFLRDVRELRFHGVAVRSLGEAWLRIAETLQGFRGEIDASLDKRSTLAARNQLVVIAAWCWKAAHDLKIESREDAAHQDIPF